MIKLVKATQEEIDTGAARLLPLSPHGITAEQLAAKLNLGHVMARTVMVDGQKAFIVFFHFDGDCLCVNAAASFLNGQDRWHELMTALDSLAEQHQCREILFHSARGGVSEKAPAHGYDPVSVLYRKEISRG